MKKVPGILALLPLLCLLPVVVGVGGCAGNEPPREAADGPADEARRIRNKPVIQPHEPEQPQEPPRPTGAAESSSESSRARSFTVLSFNDTYRLEGVEGGARGGFARVRALRQELEAEGQDVLLLHAGDFLFPSLLSRKFDGAQIIDVMNYLDGDGAAFDPRFFITFGNHEFDKSALKYASMLERRIEQSGFRWLGTNVRFVKDESGAPLVSAPNLVDTQLLRLGGAQVGLYSVTTRFGTAAYIDEIGDYTEATRRAVASLRSRGAEVVIGLTHLLLSEDTEILRRLGDDGPDLVLGGHEHEAIQAEVDGRWILKADAEAVSAVVARVTVPETGAAESVRPQVEFHHRRLGPETPAPDGRVLERIAAWNDAYNLILCTVELALDSGCLEQELGRAATELVAEELSIRRFETSLGNWIADRMLEHFADQGAEAAFMNSGSLRLNQNLPAASAITRRHLEELFAYPAELRLLEIDGATLQEVLERSISDWSGNGWFLQIGGIAFRHDPETRSVTGLTLLDADGPRAIEPDDIIRVVTTDYLVEPAGGQDGFAMLNPDQQKAVGPDVKDIVTAALRTAGRAGIGPVVEGRICNSQRPGPCLVVD